MLAAWAAGMVSGPVGPLICSAMALGALQHGSAPGQAQMLQQAQAFQQQQQQMAAIQDQQCVYVPVQQGGAIPPGTLGQRWPQFRAVPEMQGSVTTQGEGSGSTIPPAVSYGRVGPEGVPQFPNGFPSAPPGAPSMTQLMGSAAAFSPHQFLELQRKLEALSKKRARGNWRYR